MASPEKLLLVIDPSGVPETETVAEVPLKELEKVAGIEIEFVTNLAPVPVKVGAETVYVASPVLTEISVVAIAAVEDVPN